MTNLTCLLLLVITCISSAICAQENWTHLRGTNMDAHSQSQHPPVSWTDDQIMWKTEIEGQGFSSPVIFGKQIWLSSATNSGDSLFALCVDLDSGKLLQKIDLFQPKEIQHIHPTNSYASSTPAIEDGFVYLHYGTYGTACVDTKTFQVVWTRTDINCEHMQGAGSSVLIYKDFLFLHVEGTDFQFVYALNKHTGETVWKAERPQEYYKDIQPVSRKAYGTPYVITVDGKDQLISCGSQVCQSFDPMTGKENWRFFYGEDSNVNLPLFYDGILYINSGWVLSQGTPYFARMFAVNLALTGDITSTGLLWKAEKNIPQISTPVLVDSLMYMVEERGTMSCMKARTGDFVWTEPMKSQFNASPVYAAGNLYFADLKGKIYVVKASDKFELLAQNQLEGMIKATPAIVNDKLIVRTTRFLYCIGK